MCVLGVPAAVAANDAPRATWIAEWIRAEVSQARTIGVVTLRDGKLSFRESSGPAEWSFDVTTIKSVDSTNNGKALSIELMSGETYVVLVMNPDLTNASPKKLAAALERAVQYLMASRR